MALDASIIGRHGVHLRRIDDVAASGMGHMLASRSVAALTPDIPFRDLLGLDVVVHRVAAIAGWPRGSLHVVRRIERCPPIPAFRGDHIRTPGMIADDPLHRQRKIIVADLGEIALLPQAAVDEGNLILVEPGNVVGREVGDDGVRVSMKVAHHIGHRSFLPAGIYFCVAFLAGLRTDIVRRTGGSRFLGSFSGGEWPKTPNKMDQFPAVAGRFQMRIAPSGHSSELDSVFDDVVNLAVAETLG